MTTNYTYYVVKGRQRNRKKYARNLDKFYTRIYPINLNFSWIIIWHQISPVQDKIMDQKYWKIFHKNIFSFYLHAMKRQGKVGVS